MDFDYIDGLKIEQTIINKNYDLIGVHKGSIKVKNGKFYLIGTIQGSLTIDSHDIAEIKGTQQGSVKLSPNTTVLVEGKIQGSTIVSIGATLIIENTGKLQGHLTNNGKVIIRGMLAGVQDGQGELIIEGSGNIKKPVVKNGINYY